MLIPPGGSGGVGIYLTEPAGGDLGVLLTFRHRAAPGGMGFRVGLAEDRGDDLSVHGGVDVGGWLTTASDDFPLDVAWFAGAGAGIGDAVLLTLPAGISLGRTVVGEDARFIPYVAPRLMLDAWLGNDVDDALELGLAVDIGLNLAFQAAWEIRFAGTLGDHRAIAVGVGFTGG
jgi:hypothetical protein